MVKIKFSKRTYSGTSLEVLHRMACGDPETEAWLDNVSLIKTTNGFWVAWHKDEGDNVGRVAVLVPDHPSDKKCLWLEDWDGCTIWSYVKYIESGEFESEGPPMLNLFILEVRDKDGNRIPELEDEKPWWPYKIPITNETPH